MDLYNELQKLCADLDIEVKAVRRLEVNMLELMLIIELHLLKSSWN